jgi:HTH-type transcriptional regulator, competence development regulator
MYNLSKLAMIILKSKLGEKLRELRKLKEETLNNVSENMGLDLALLSKIERGERLPTIEQLTKLSNYYGCNIKDLKTLMVAEKIIKEYGISEETHNAISMVEEQIEKYLKK